MTKKTRYVLFGSAGALLAGLATGLVAYLAYTRSGPLPDGLPPEVRYVPANAEVVAFANVRSVMNSELRRELLPTLEGRSRKGQQMMNDFAGVDLEKQVDHVMAYVEPYTPADPNTREQPEIPRGLLLVHGSFDQARIEQFVRDRGGEARDYNGAKIFVHREHQDHMAVGVVSANLIAIGQPDLVRRAIDRVRDPSGGGQDITANAEMMNLIRDNAGSTAWVVGQVDAVRRRMRLPSAVTDQVPPVRLVSAKADVDGGVKATIRAEAGDKAAADQLRDVLRGFISLARLQGGHTPQFDTTLKSIELSGTDNTVQMSFAVAPDTLRMLAPRPPSR